MKLEPTNIPTLTNALDEEKMIATIGAVSDEELAILAHELNIRVYYWMKNPSQKRIDRLRDDFPILNSFIDFDIINSRLKILDQFPQKDDFFGVHIEAFMPELYEFRIFAGSRLDSIPRGISKAELWLLPIAKNAGATEDVEAAVYFASRKKSKNAAPAEISQRWYDAICDSIIQGVPAAPLITPELKEQAEKRNLPLSDAAALLTFHGEMPMFFETRAYYDTFIYATFFRSVEWLDINEFQDWVDSYASELSLLAQGGMEHKSICWFLFHICRSDLALSKIDPEGLNSLIWLLSKGNLEIAKPWRQSSWTAKFPETIDHLPIAASLIFASKRISNSRISSELIKGCIDIIFSMQKNSGGWPVKSDDPDAAIEATCLAIHALALAKPTGWKKACLLGKNWLLTQQRQTGCWTIDGGPTVMLTVLSLDAINLADEIPVTTFGQEKVKTTAIEADPVYDFKGISWYGQDFPDTKPVSIDKVHTEVLPELAITVAVEVELRQALLNLKPPHKARKILKVTDTNDTYYIGRFGKFNAVVTMCAMGSEGSRGSTLSVNDLIRRWKPKAIIMPGIAFGIDKKKHEPADVLISEMLYPYELQRVGDVNIPRSPAPPANPTLLDRYRHAVEWKFERPDRTRVKRVFGGILTGGKLVDNTPFKEQLLKLFPEAIGGEMEGSGLWSASARGNTPWILIKAVCDWGDGHKHKEYQEMAAASSISLCLHVFNDPNALYGL